MSKEILEGIKDTDCRLKKVFDDMMEQGKRTNQLLQTSFEQMRSSSQFVSNNNHSTSMSYSPKNQNISNQHHSQIHHYHSNSSPNNSIQYKNTNHFTTLPSFSTAQQQLNTELSKSILQTTHQDHHHTENTNNNNNNQCDVSVGDTEALLRSPNETHILNQCDQTDNLSCFSVSERKDHFQHNAHFGEDCDADDSLLSSLQSSLRWNIPPSSQNPPISSQLGQRSKDSNIWIRACQEKVSFGRVLLGEDIEKAFELQNWTDQDITVELTFTQNQEGNRNSHSKSKQIHEGEGGDDHDNHISDVFRLEKTRRISIITIQAYGSVSVIVSLDFTSLFAMNLINTTELQQSQSICIQHSTSPKSIHIPLSISIIPPSLYLSSAALSQPPALINSSLISIVATPNSLDQITIYLESKTPDKYLDLEFDINYRFKDAKVTFFPRNIVLKSAEIKKISISVFQSKQNSQQLSTTSSTQTQQQQKRIMCFIIKIRNTQIVYVVKITCGDSCF